MHLNYLPLRFTSDAFKGGVLHFAESGKKQSIQENPLTQKLQELRRDQGRDYIFHYSGNDIYCIPLKPDAITIGDPKQFDILTDFQLANVLARSALESFFKGSKKTVIGHKPIYLLLEEHNLASERQDVFGLFPEYSLDVRPLAPHEGDISSGVLIGFGIRYVFLRNVAELQAEGIDPIEKYVVRLDDAENPSPYHRRYLGRIDSIANGIAALSDSDFSEYPLDQCYFEGSRTNIEYVGRTLLGRNYESFSNNLLTQTFNVMGAENQVKRLNDLGSWLESKSPLPCAAGISIRISKTPHQCPQGTDAGYSHSFKTPSCILRPGGSITVPWPIDKQIDQHGPYDAESFPDKRVKIAVICPEEFIGEAEEFLRQFKDGVHSTDDRAPFRQGFLRKYHLHGCDFSFHAVARTSSSLEDAFKAASLEALLQKPHLAITIIREQYRTLPDSSNPYYTTKARMMAQGCRYSSLKSRRCGKPAEHTFSTTLAWPSMQSLEEYPGRLPRTRI